MMVFKTKVAVWIITHKFGLKKSWINNADNNIIPINKVFYFL